MFIRLVFTANLLLATILLCAQKPSITDSSIRNWPSIDNFNTTSDGRFIYYQINEPGKKGTLVVKATDGTWEKQIESGVAISFLIDGKTDVVFRVLNKLYLLKLGSDSISHLSNGVIGYKVCDESNVSWLAYNTDDSSHGLFLLNAVTNETVRYENVIDYFFDPQGKLLVVDAGSKKLHELKVLRLPEVTENVIWKGSSTIKNLAFDQSGSQLSFIEQLNGLNGIENSIWYYNANEQKAQKIITNKSSGIDSGLFVSDAPLEFSQRGKCLFFSVEEKPVVIPEHGVDVWSYFDEMIQEIQLASLKDPSSLKYKFVIILDRKVVTRLETTNERVLKISWSSSSSKDELKNDEVAILVKRKAFSTMDEWNWNDACKSSVSILDLCSGQRTILGVNLIGRLSQSYYLSPNGRNVVFYNPKSNRWFTYSMDEKRAYCISGKIVTKWNASGMRSEFSFYSAGVQGWMLDGDAVVVNDFYGDLWVLDCFDKQTPKNLTNGLGRRKGILFRVNVSMKDKSGCLNTGKIFLNAFKQSEKVISLYSVDSNNGGDPKCLTSSYGTDFIKAKKGNSFLLRSANVSEFPNYFSTSDFKSFFRITDLHPEKKYNWLQAEVVHWKTFDNITATGVLYKPENFDPKNTYPLVFTFYDDVGMYVNDNRNLNQYDIPRLVSNGFLVCVPSIIYKANEPSAQGAFNTIVSCANNLSKLSFVNNKAIGLRGHSFGAYQVNYIISRSRIFSAAVSSDGMTNAISGAYEDSWILDHIAPTSTQSYYEMGQPNMLVNFWQRPDLYIKYSPVLFADRINVPLLLNANKNDGTVSFNQSFGLFMALRRLGKKAWLLQYDGAGHGWGNDFDFRVLQFFNHYLKREGAPRWMTRGIPAKMKGKDFGYDLDTTIATPPESTLIRNDVILPQQIELLKHKTRVTNDGRIEDAIYDNK